MLRFHINIVGGLRGEPVPISFDAAFARLKELPRLFIEPDGSFVWTGDTADGQRWQMDGNLIDRGDVLAYVELNGHCPAERFDNLLRCFGWPQGSWAFQMIRSGLTVSETEFRESARKAGEAV
jgi:hypothetical protein